MNTLSSPLSTSAPSARFALAALALGALALGGCAADDSAAAGGSDVAGPQGAQPPDAPPGATGVTPAGAQDFGQFRRILEAGDIPHPDTLDPLGFFAEHKMDYPLPDCGDELCMHGLLAVGANLMTGTNCTLLQIGLNTPINPAELDRPPLDLVLAVDVSGSMNGPPITYVRFGLSAMLEHLQPADRVSLVTYSNEARVVFEGLSVDSADEINAAIERIRATGSTNLYDGLFTALQIADRASDAALDAAEDREQRVIFLSDGVATAGLAQRTRLQALAEAYARRGIGITTIGVGEDFDPVAMRSVAETGAGNFYFLEDPQAVSEVFTEEVLTFMVPVALDVQIELYAGDGYTVRGAYGANGWTGGLRSGIVDIPSLFLAGRQRSDDPVGQGRRGGGGGILIELMPRLAAQAGEGAEVGRLRLSYTDPRTLERREQAVEVVNPFAPGATPLGGHFTHETVQKGFVMLNLLVGFQLATELALEADHATGIAVLAALRDGVAEWLETHDDPDIEDDLRYVDLFLANLESDQARIGVRTPPPENPPEPWPAD